MTRLTVRLLGPFQANLDGIPVTRFESEKVRAMLAYLMVESEMMHRREKLAGLFWADMPEIRARSNLSQALYNLVHLLKEAQNHPPYLLRSRESVQFNPQSDYWVDAAEFTRLLAEIALHNHGPSDLCASCLGKLQQAVALYRGDFLEGLEYGTVLGIEEWCLIRRARFNRQASEALQSLATYLEQQGETGRALNYAWMQVDLDPYYEPAQRQLMRLLAASQQRNQALAQYKRLETLLADELGVAPEQETIDLYELIRATPAVRATLESKAHNLPAALTPFIGRQKEVAELGGYLLGSDCRVLTIHGPGGSGKTRLAVEVARWYLAAFKHGAFFVGVSGVQTGQAILPAVVEALAYPLQETKDAGEQLSNYLRDKNLLLVMDGFEHVLDSAGWLAEILHAAPQVKILVTSRSRLNIKGEHIYTLMGLPYPEQATKSEDVLASDAVQLFLDGARRLSPDFKPRPGDLEHILRVCSQVQGMPLGILLASSWVASMELQEIAAEIERNLDFLSGEWADVPARQRSLRATFDHSWKLLSPRQQGIIKTLSVFHGGFNRHAALAVAGATPHELRSLVDKSLLIHKSPGRFEIHELLRQYSAEKQAASAEDDLTNREKQGLYYCDVLAAWGDSLKSPQQESALEEMDIELENLRSAWNWAAEQGISPRLRRMVEPLCLYYDLRVCYPEGECACRMALDGLASSIPAKHEQPTRVQLVIWQSHFNRLLGRHELAQRQLKACQALLAEAQHAGLDVRFEQALLSFELGNSIHESDFAKAGEHYQHSLALFQELEQPWWSATILLNIVICNLQVGDFEAAQSGFELCLSELPVHGDRRSLAKALRWKGFLHVRRGELEQGMQSMQEAAAVYRAIGDRVNIADSVSGLGTILAWQGRFLEAKDLLAQSLSIYQELGDRYQTAFMHLLLGLVLVFMGRYPEAEEPAHTCLSLAGASDFRRLAGGAQLVMGWVALSAGDTQSALEVLLKSVAEYRQAKQLDELGWALAALGQAHLTLGETQAGLACIREALQIGAQTRAALTICQALGPSAVWLGRHGDRERAVALYSLARLHPGMGKSRWFEDIYGGEIAALAEHLPEESVAAAQQRGRELDLGETARKLIEELA